MSVLQFHHLLRNYPVATYPPGSPAIVATMSMKNKLQKEYANLMATTFSRNPRMFDTETVHTFAHFEWAFTMLFSRAIRLDNLSEGPAVCLGELRSKIGQVKTRLNTSPRSETTTRTPIQ